ncbi:MAG: hypothetical protein C0415_04610 [Thermodesulfovibrio sp.]|nr:hypothetical protein [Thermodesulfovibrio sp.]
MRDSFKRNGGVIKKSIHILSIFCFAAIFLFFIPSVFAEDSNELKNTPSFTNKDIERYKESPDKLSSAKKDKFEKETKGRKKLEEPDKNYWCKKGTFYSEKVERLKVKVKEAEERLARKEAESSSKRVLRKEKRHLNKEKEDLRKAEQEFVKLENEAHRKGIPPGWLKCNFSY